ncbi:hypothetical protein MLD38_015541 [Melastoma candidum]|uniref:Uncharacterized protein n=1 Tax=Melastoma candidum TaxID=119954 RepID=A0ACB9RGH4_9MYRT|nr:hypothetical protein MLD38_015541 [Melastoma candidum]
MAAGTCSASPWHPPHDVVSLSSSPGGSTHPCSDGNRVGNNSEREADDQDLISQLPNSIIGEIFSFLTMEEIVKTSVLSRLWRFQVDRDKDDFLLSLRPGSSLQTQELPHSLDRPGFGSVYCPGHPKAPCQLRLCAIHEGKWYCSLKAVQDDGVDWRSLRALCIDKTRQLTLLMKGHAERLDLYGIVTALRGAPVMEKLVLNLAQKTVQDNWLHRPTFSRCPLREIKWGSRGLLEDTSEEHRDLWPRCGSRHRLENLGCRL